MNRRGRLSFVAVCLLVFALIAALITWGLPSTGPSTKTPAGLAVTDLRDLSQLQAQFNDDQGMPRLVLALAPT